MKPITTILKSIILTATITLLTLTSNQTITLANTDTISTYENISITNVLNDEIATVIINNKEYTFDEAYGWQIGDKAKVTIDNVTNKIIEVRPFITERERNKLSDNGTTYTNSLTTDAELREYSTKWLKDNYNLTLDIPIEFNIVYNNNDSNFTIYGSTEFIDNKPVKIIIDSNLIDKGNIVKIERVLIHELIHYSLAQFGNEYNDKTNAFENAIMKYGSVSNDGTTYYLHSHVLVNQNL